jgi:hypothetical protein
MQRDGDVAIGGLPATEIATVNQTLLGEYLLQREHAQTRRSHLFNGRYENIYIPRNLIPSIEPVLSMALFYARQLLDVDPAQLQLGFWFNEMQPGDRTTLHTHDDDDELLSAVYYIQARANSGDLKIHTKSAEIRYISPKEGNIILFSPQLPHEVSENFSDELRLAVAMNFGRMSSDDSDYYEVQA